MDNRKLLMFGFIACILAALAYAFVFADVPFATPEPGSRGTAAAAPAATRDAARVHAIKQALIVGASR